MDFCWSLMLFRAGLSFFPFQIASCFVLGFSPPPCYNDCHDFANDFSVLSLLFELYDLFEWKHLGILSRPLTQFLWTPLLITSHFFQDVISSTCRFFQTWPDTDTALNVRTFHPSSWAWSSQAYWMKKLLSGMPHTISPVLCPSPLHST